VTSGFALAWQPLAQYADFGGRSRRSDLAFFYLLTGLLTALIDWGELALGFEYHRWVALAFLLALLCPWTALAVRRLHDTGRTGWWFLLALPVLALKLGDAWRRTGDPFALSAQSSLPTFVTIPLGLALLVLLGLLFEDDEEGTNIYGPNPRYGEIEAAP
jgi:uncharacterized membrane protein YhaH (DUF805 family)